MAISSINNPNLGASFANNSADAALSSGSKRLTISSSQSVQLALSGELDGKVMSLEDKRQTALQVVNKTLAAAYEKIASRSQSVSAEYQTFEPLTAEKVANNILGFIERRLTLDRAEGASQEALAARLEAGLSGFKKGFAEAAEKLEALSLLAPAIEADIGKTYDLVLEGVDQLRAKFIDSTAPAAPKSDSAAPAAAQLTSKSKPASAANTGAPTKLDVPEFIPAPASYLGYANYEYGRAREFSFELTTKEGDKVVIKAASSEGFSAQSANAGGASSLNASYSASQSFSLNVEGDLNEEELVAINDLLSRVNNLAAQFFEGDLDGAFAQAMSLGYDQQQIGSFALNLAQAEIQQVTSAYQAFEPSGSKAQEGAANLLADSLGPMGNFIRDLLDSLERASVFAEPESLLVGMAERVTGESDMDQLQGRRFSGFMQELLALNLNEPVL